LRRKAFAREKQHFGFLLAVPVALVVTAFFAAIVRILFKTGSLPVRLCWLAAGAGSVPRQRRR